jgi:hypothetical protein
MVAQDRDQFLSEVRRFWPLPPGKFTQPQNFSTLWVPFASTVLAENPIRLKMGLDWTCTMLLSWILTVYLGINLQPSLIQSLTVQPRATRA